MAQLTPELLYRQVQYLVEAKDCSRKGDEVEAAP